MKKRVYEKILKRELLHYPAVTLIGPRQCGKTTLAKSLPCEYFDLEKQEDQIRLEATWADIILQKKLVVFDEAQNYPTLFSKLRSAIDERRKINNRFLILGSIAPSLRKNISESLAGRSALIEMTPFLASEIKAQQLDQLWHFGGYPDGGIIKQKMFPNWQQYYLTTLSQRDLPIWGLNAKPTQTQRLFQMLASMNGQIWNASQIGASLGITYHTINTYTDFLTEVFLIRKLQPYFINTKKRITKSPKIYWRDSGLLHSLLSFHGSKQDLFSCPWVGASWESFIVEQILSILKSQNILVNPFFFRIDDKQEIDLVLETSKGLFAIEIKLTSDPSSAFYQNLIQKSDLIKAKHKILISRTKKEIQNNSFLSTNFFGSIRHLTEILS